MTMYRFVIILSVLVAGPVMAQDDADASAVEALGELESLDAQRLSPGACGLFLWTRRQEPQFILFAGSDTNTALVKAQGRELAFERAPTGEVISGRAIHQNYAHDERRLSLSLALKRGAKVNSGERIDEGVITIADETGWERKIPVTGVAACQPPADR